MAQTKNIRRVAPTEARAKLVNVRISPQKLNLVAASIRGMPVQKALNELEFSRKRIATDVRKVLYSAISNAENNHNLDIDNLVVAEAFVGKNLLISYFLLLLTFFYGLFLWPRLCSLIIVMPVNRQFRVNTCN